MIAGIGVDVVDIERMTDLLGRHGPAFARRLLHPDEAAPGPDGEGEAVRLARLFAAKEAVMKALGTGMAGAAFREIRISRDAQGRPAVDLTGGALDTANVRGIGAWRLALACTPTSAVAFAIALRAP